ncbi:branched-chain amino acid ABC transporter permease [Parathalassolituus penaei]|uniref:Branched-chain amino acid ABC transporter permease n=1 Tax=Parathalassolituus penaei TaxID=2997323 RepID=A0A9X3ITH9_9GAMM|nr:branched-chain amino acid ABC transporter permease [Parathalassolituus penaei]MCY0966335.1 branched-chain amino acid ABC transporter permease [Parathalassolituus penaei]
MIETVIHGILLGGLYSLFALGLSLMFGVMRLTNIAHGDQIVISGFMGIAIAAAVNINPFLLILLLVPCALVSGYAFQYFVLNRTIGKDPLPSLVITFGLSIIAQNLLQEIFSANPRALDTGGLNTMGLNLGGDTVVGVLPLIILVCAIACTFGLQWMFAHTALGRSFRAVSDEKDIAELMGLNSARVYSMATAIAFSLVALAGLFQSMRTTVSPTDGPNLLLFAFESVIIGGMGSFWGTFLGAMTLGVAQQVGFHFDPGWGIWFGHLVFILILAFRPSGLFPKTKG